MTTVELPTHDAPTDPLTVVTARRLMQRHRECSRERCSAKYAAWRYLIDAGELTPPLQYTPDNGAE